MKDLCTKDEVGLLKLVDFSLFVDVFKEECLDLLLLICKQDLDVLKLNKDLHLS